MGDSGRGSCSTTLNVAAESVGLFGHFLRTNNPDLFGCSSHRPNECSCPSKVQVEASSPRWWSPEVRTLQGDEVTRMEPSRWDSCSSERDPGELPPPFHCEDTTSRRQPENQEQLLPKHRVGGHPNFGRSAPGPGRSRPTCL